MNQQNQQNGDQQPKMPRFNMNWIYGLIIVVLMVMFFTDGGSILGQTSATKVSYSNFKGYVSRGYASKVEINKTENYLRMYVYGRNVDRKSVV